MLKGCQREMIVVHTQKSKVFEHAYFVLRRECRTLQHSDILGEANRLVESVLSSGVGRKRSLGRVGVFWIGVSLGLGAGRGLFLLFSALFGH